MASRRSRRPGRRDRQRPGSASVRRLAVGCGPSPRTGRTSSPSPPLNAIFGIGAAFILIPLTFGSDATIYRRGAQGIHDGFYAKDFLYAPLTGILATPLTWVPLPVAAARDGR